MRVLNLLGVSVAGALSLGGVQQTATPCTAVGEVQFICDLISPEDLAVVPGAEWVIASGDQEGGRIHLVNVQDKTATLLFPTPTRRERLDATTYPTCPGAPELASAGCCSRECPPARRHGPAASP